MQSVKQPQNLSGERPAPLQSAASPHDAAATSRSVLIVEDDFIIGLFLESILSSRGYGLAGLASRGDEAIRLARELEPDLILMDIGLAGPLDGLDAGIEIRAHSEVQIVLMTGNLVLTRQDPRLARLRPAAILIKPFDEERLLAELEALFPKA